MSIIINRVRLSPRWAILLEGVALLLIVALALYLRTTHLADNPGWYTDETTHLDIARHLLAGEVRYMVITQSTLLFGRPPLFHLLLTGWLRLFGDDLAALRLFTTALNALSCGLLYGLVRRAGDRWLALLAALMLALYPQAILYSRFGFSYNLLVPLLLLALWLLGDGTSRRGRLLAALVIGLCLITDVFALALAAALMTWLLLTRWRALPDLLPLMIPPIIYTVVMLLLAPDAFWFDLRFTLTRLNSLDLAGQVANLANNYLTLIGQDGWMLAGLIGLFLLRPPHLRGVCLLFAGLPFILIGRTVPFYSLSAYYTIPLLPFVALGVAGLMRYGAPYIVKGLRESFGRAGHVVGLGLTLALLGTPLVDSLSRTLTFVEVGFPTPIDPFLTDPQDARTAAAYLNPLLKPDDVVIAAPSVGWLFHADVADFQMSIAVSGVDTPHLPGNIPADRLAFDPRFAAADYAVVDNLWRNWGVIHVPGLREQLVEIESQWSRLFQVGAITIYRRI